MFSRWCVCISLSAERGCYVPSLTFLQSCTFSPSFFSGDTGTHTENPTSIFMGHYHPCLGCVVIKWTSDYNDTPRSGRSRLSTPMIDWRSGWEQAAEDTGGAFVSHLAQSAGVTYGCRSVLSRRRDCRLCLVARTWLLWFTFGVLFAPCLCWFAIR